RRRLRNCMKIVTITARMRMYSVVVCPDSSFRNFWIVSKFFIPVFSPPAVLIVLFGQTWKNLKAKSLPFYLVYALEYYCQVKDLVLRELNLRKDSGSPVSPRRRPRFFRA